MTVTVAAAVDSVQVPVRQNAPDAEVTSTFEAAGAPPGPLPRRLPVPRAPAAADGRRRVPPLPAVPLLRRASSARLAGRSSASSDAARGARRAVVPASPVPPAPIVPADPVVPPVSPAARSSRARHAAGAGRPSRTGWLRTCRSRPRPRRRRTPREKNQSAGVPFFVISVSSCEGTTGENRPATNHCPHPIANATKDNPPSIAATRSANLSFWRSLVLCHRDRPTIPEGGPADQNELNQSQTTWYCQLVDWPGSLGSGVWSPSKEQNLTGCPVMQPAMLVQT